MHLNDAERTWNNSNFSGIQRHGGALNLFLFAEWLHICFHWTAQDSQKSRSDSCSFRP